MAESRLQTAPRTVFRVCHLHNTQCHLCVHDLETALLEATRTAGGQLHPKAFAGLQEAWLAQHCHRFSARR